MCAPFCMWLHCYDMLLCPDLRMKTVNSSSWGGSPTSVLTRNTCLIAILMHTDSVGTVFVFA